MTNLIQSFPYGLQSVLDLKGGELPKDLLTTVQPVLDLTQFYLLQKQESRLFTAKAAATDIQTWTDGTVPAGETWYVWQYDIAFTPGAGAQATCAPAVQFGLNGYVLATPRAAAATIPVRVSAQVPFLAVAGSIFGFMCETQTLAPNITGYALISRLRT